VRLEAARAEARDYADLMQAAGILQADDITEQELRDVALCLGIWMQKAAGNNPPHQLKELAQVTLRMHNDFSI
jgi:hypothetical protein